MSTEYSDVEFDEMQKRIDDLEEYEKIIGSEKEDLKRDLDFSETRVKELEEAFENLIPILETIHFGSGQIHYKTNGNLDALEVMELFTAMLGKYTMSELREKLK